MKYCGDYDMHGKNMKRATRECNFKFIISLYPIVEHVKMEIKYKI